MKSIKICLLGFGTIGSSVARILVNNKKERDAQGATATSPIADIYSQVELSSVVSLDLPSVQAADFIDPATTLITESFDEALALNPDIVIELIGGVEPARTFIIKALESGAHVVTANKAVLGTHGAELRAAAKAQGKLLLYEASVGGCVPIVRGIKNSLIGDKIISIRGVLNGTTNFILDKMTREGADYADVLKEAQALGFAEADPTADVEGFDPAAKLSILASLAFGQNYTMADVKTQGITAITQGMIIAARNNNQVYKLVATATFDYVTNQVAMKVEPELVPEKSAFGELQGSMNGVEVTSEYSGTLTFFGFGAGGDPTASAVLADVIEIIQLINAHAVLGI